MNKIRIYFSVSANECFSYGFVIVNPASNWLIGKGNVTGLRLFTTDRSFLKNKFKHKRYKNNEIISEVIFEEAFKAVFRIRISFHADPDPGSVNVHMDPDPDPLIFIRIRIQRG